MKVRFVTSSYCRNIGFERCIELDNKIIDTSEPSEQKCIPPIHGVCQCITTKLIGQEPLKFTRILGLMRKRGTLYRRKLK